MSFSPQWSSTSYFYKNHGVFVEPLRLEQWIEPLRCLNSKMISVGVFKEPSEEK